MNAAPTPPPIDTAKVAAEEVATATVGGEGQGAATARVAWFGKLPALGDFASRRLSPEAVQAWDACLSEGLEACRAAWGEAWLDHYLGAPVCCFVQGEDREGDPPTAGVLMPSVDRAGRYFPLLLLHPLETLPADDTGWQTLQVRLDELAALALALLAPGAGVEQLEAALAALEVDAAPAHRTGPEEPCAATPDGDGAGLALLHDLLRDRSLWWQGPAGPGRWTHLDARWPTARAFTAWLQG